MVFVSNHTSTIFIEQENASQGDSHKTWLQAVDCCMKHVWTLGLLATNKNSPPVHSDTDTHTRGLPRYTEERILTCAHAHNEVNKRELPSLFYLRGHIGAWQQSTIEAMYRQTLQEDSRAVRPHNPAFSCTPGSQRPLATQDLNIPRTARTIAWCHKTPGRATTQFRLLRAPGPQ